MTNTTYDHYLTEPGALDFNTMQKLHSDLVDEIGNDVDANELYDELIEIATHYAAIRAGWHRLSIEEKATADASRTSVHNSMIIHFNMLARCLRQQGKKAAWRDILGNESSYCRKSIGDFGCYLIFVNSICAR